MLRSLRLARCRNSVAASVSYALVDHTGSRGTAVNLWRLICFSFLSFSCHVVPRSVEHKIYSAKMLGLARCRYTVASSVSYALVDNTGSCGTAVNLWRLTCFS